MRKQLQCLYLVLRFSLRGGQTKIAGMPQSHYTWANDQGIIEIATRGANKNVYLALTFLNSVKRACSYNDHFSV